MSAATSPNERTGQFYERFLWRAGASVVWTLLLGIVLIIIILIGRASLEQFLDSRNVGALIRQLLPYALLAAPMALIMASGGLDFSIGAVVALTGMIIASQVEAGIDVGVAFLAALFVALVIGLVNGLLVGLTRIHGALITLGMMAVLRGLTLVMTEGRPIVLREPGFLGDLYTSVVPWLVLALLVLFVLVLTALTPFGRRPRAAEADREHWLARAFFVGTPYVLSSLMAGFAGAILLGRLRAAQPTVGTGWELEVILAVVVGGTPLGGGFANVIGAMLGAVVTVALTNIALLIGVSAYVTQFREGALLIGSALFAHAYAWIVGLLYRGRRKAALPVAARPAPTLPPAWEPAPTSPPPAAKPSADPLAGPFAGDESPAEESGEGATDE